MNTMINRFNHAMGKIQGGKQQLEAANKDLWLTDNDRRNRKEAVSKELRNEVEAAAGEIWNEALDDLADAHVNLQQTLKGDSQKKQGRAAIMGAAYASMQDDELLRVLDDKFHDDTERGLILDYLEARATGRKKEQGHGGLGAVEDPLQRKIKETTNRNLDRLTGYPANRVESLRKAQDGEAFARNAEVALQTEMLKHGNELQGVDLVRRRDALNNIEALKEKHLTVDEKHQNKSGANPYSGPRAKRGTQRGR